MTVSNKTQLRSLKKALKTNVTSRTQSYSPNSLIAPSTAQSECSTLVDYGDNYTAEYLDEDEYQQQDTESILGSDNSAWTRSRSSQSATSTSSVKSARTDTAVMLDSDDMSWNLPRDAKRSIPTRILHALAGQ